MKTSLGRRWLSLLLTTIMCLSLIPAAFADDAVLEGITVTLDHTELSIDAGKTETLTPTVMAQRSDGSSTPVDSGLSYEWSSSNSSIASVSNNGMVTGVNANAVKATITVKVSYSEGTINVDATAACTVTVVKSGDAITITTTSPLRTGKGLGATLNVEANGERYAFRSEDEDIASVDNFTRYLTAHKPGETKIYAFLQSDTSVESEPLIVIVSGISIKEEPFKVAENETLDLTEAVECFGDADKYTLTFSSRDSYIAQINGSQITGLQMGEATIEVRSNGGAYIETFKVQVTPDPSTEINVGTLKTADTLPFSGLNFSSQLNGKVRYVTGLLVPTNQGTLYYNYKSEANPGFGVGQIESYYRSYEPGQRLLSDITFVPKSDYAGGPVTINYTAITEDGRSYSCKITFILQGGGSSGSSTVDGIRYETSYNNAVRFEGLAFDQVCREQLAASLSYVTFSQPPERQGTLYTNYSASSNYGSPVDIRRQYTKKDLDDVWFVPAPGFTGTVTVYYTAHASGSNAGSFTGRVTITVEQEKDGSVIGGLHFDIARGGVARFDDEKFNDYCRDLLDNGQTLSFIRFAALPSESEGVLYYDFSTSANPGSTASLDTSYYYGTRTPRIDRLTFVAAENYTGTVRIPFTGWTLDGTSFSGNVEINVRGGVASGDIIYTCAPGRTVNFRVSDFSGLSNQLTGRTVDYIIFQSLPNSSDGTVYHNSTLASTSTRYYNGSGSAKISNLSFRAASSFSGTVNIPFTGYSSNGGSFAGVITITSNGSGSSGSGSSGNIHYTTDSNSTVVFNRYDFDDVSRWETDYGVSSVRFEVPSSSRGTLYRGYRSDSNPGTKISSSGTSITASSLDQVAFVPSSGYTGTVYIDFTATANNGGGTFTGTVEIEVGQPAAGKTVQYSTRTAPIRLYNSDLAQSGSNSLQSIRFTALPPTNAGYLYYQYISPTRYGRQISLGSEYNVSGSNLVSDLSFVPKAGYSGTVTIPYTGTNTNNSTFTGEIVITVSPTYGSSYFNDLSGYSSAQLAAVDFLYEHNITSGMSASQYGPQNSIRRGDFALMLYRAFELSPSAVNGAFSDVPSEAYYATAVNSLYARGIVGGVGDGRYDPEGTLTRQDAICMVQRAMRTMGWSAGDGYDSALYSFSDGSAVAGYARGAMAFAVQRGYLPIYTGQLSPYQPLTRIDMAEIIHRVLTY